MEQNLVVLQGNTFTVELPSNLGSTNYGWCIKGLPKDIVMMYAYNERAGRLGMPGAPVIQKFVFGVVSAENIDNEIEFVLICHSDLKIIADKFTAYIKIVPCYENNFTPYSENANITYGYSCGSDDTYNTIYKYGYPCGVNDANLKYGYPCTQQEAMKDARPYGMVYENNSQCCEDETSKAAIPYGLIYNTPFIPKHKNMPVLKYGYPGCC